MIAWRMRCGLLALAGFAAAVPFGADAHEPALPRGLKLTRVLVVMRHGVRPPTKAQPLPGVGITDTWPSWPVPLGYLTPHGASAIRLIARYDRASWRAQGLLPERGCAPMRIVADSDQRTIATAAVYAAALTPGCAATIDHLAQDTPDPRFGPIAAGATAYDPVAALAAARAGAGPGGLAAVEARMRPLLARLDTILCAPAAPTCGVSRELSAFAPPDPRRKPKLTGALDAASTAAQSLLLAYADGKPMAEVGWGRASAADLARLSEFHALEFRLLARPRVIAAANVSLLAPIVIRGLTAADAPAVTIISGHDTDLASFAGLLGVHWQVPGLAADDPAPGGALVFEQLIDRADRAYVRVLYRSQTIAQIRALAEPGRSPPYVRALQIEGCKAYGIRGLCTARQFGRAMAR